MANITKMKRDEMLAFLQELRVQHTDDASIRAFSEIENALTEKKFGLVFEEHTEEVDEKLLTHIPVLCADSERRICKDPTLPWNFVIEGDNLQALYLLEKTHRGRVDCIYIDPPYNKGNKDWKYNNDYVDANDTYRHSKWLSMMRVRLEIAKRLLNPKDSVLICTIDETECLHVGCLLEELFPDARIQVISDVINPRGATRDGQFSRSDEYLFIVQIGENSVVYPKAGTKHYVEWYRLRRTDYDSRRGTTKGGTQQFYPIYIDISTEKIVHIGTPLLPDENRNSVPAIDGAVAVFPIKNDGTEMNWGVTPDTLQLLIDNHFVRVRKNSKGKPQPYLLHYISYKQLEAIECGRAAIEGYNQDGTAIVVEDDGHVIRPGSAWNIPSHNAGTYGSEILAEVIGEKRFDFPKSVYSVLDDLRYFLINKRNAIVVDFFAGSGTTQHAVNLLNAEDGGHRQCIMVTNNELSAKEEKRLSDAGFHKGDEEWERLGIARYVTWPRTLCSIKGHNIAGKPLEGDYGVEVETYEQDEDSTLISKSTGKPMRRNIYIKVKKQLYPELARIKKADGFQANVKYFKCDWTPRKPEDYLLSNALCLHIREMIELQNAIELDGVKNVLILNKEDFERCIMVPDAYAQIEHIWVNQNIIFTAEELKLLAAKDFRYIPREFFGQELKEAAE